MTEIAETIRGEIPEWIFVINGWGFHCHEGVYGTAYGAGDDGLGSGQAYGQYTTSDRIGYGDPIGYTDDYGNFNEDGEIAMMFDANPVDPLVSLALGVDV